MSCTPARVRRGIMLGDSLVGVAVIAILAALLIPAVQQVREAARKSQCQDHLHNIAIALHNYETTFTVLPPGACDGWGKHPESRYSWAVFILPFVEQAPLYHRIADQAANRQQEGLPDPGERHDFWNADLDLYRCPSDAHPKRRDHAPAFLNYKASIGDVLQDNSIATRGVFGFRSSVKFADIRDGTSNTLFVGEMLVGREEGRLVPGGVALKVTDSTPQACWDRIDPRRRTLTGDVRDSIDYVGGRAWDGRAYYAFLATAVSPNGPTCQSSNKDAGWGHLTASSRHPGGSQVTLADGKVSFISENIDSGDRDALAPDGSQQDLRSPYGIWGALGTRAGGEVLRVP